MTGDRPGDVHGLDAQGVIEALGLAPHPEGGHYREVYRHAAPGGGRGWVTSIYFLLKADEVSCWHRVADAAEIWCWHAGAPLELSVHAEGGARQTHVLGMDIGRGQRPQAVVPANAWQAARPLADAPPDSWTLVGCQVAPAFVFESFVLAEPGFEPA